MTEPLKNWKTILGMLTIGVLSFVVKMEWMTMDTYTWIIAVVGPLTGISMRLGMGKKR